MRDFLSISGPLMLAATIVSSTVTADAPQERQAPGTITGIARTVTGLRLQGASVQIREIRLNTVAAQTISGPAGEFRFDGVVPGRYIVEVVDAGKVAGTTSVFTLESGMTLGVDVVAIGSGLLAESGRAGFSFLGLGPAATSAVLGAAGAAAVTAVVSTRTDPSPSR
jgi:hypothetical protein